MPLRKLNRANAKLRGESIANTILSMEPRYYIDLDSEEAWLELIRPIEKVLGGIRNELDQLREGIF